MNMEANSTKHGTVAPVRGSVADVRFDGHQPPIRTLLRAADDGRIVIEVLPQRDALLI